MKIEDLKIGIKSIQGTFTVEEETTGVLIKNKNKIIAYIDTCTPYKLSTDYKEFYKLSMNIKEQIMKIIIKAQ